MVASSPVLRGAGTTAVAHKRMLDVRCASIDFDFNAACAAVRAALKSMQSNTRVVVTPPGGVPREARVRIVPDTKEKCAHVTVHKMGLPTTGEYRYVVTYKTPSAEHTQKGAVLVYRTLGEINRLVRTVRFELAGQFVDLNILKTDDARTRAVLFRCKLLQIQTSGRAMTRAELHLPEVRKRVKEEMDTIKVTLRSGTSLTTTMGVTAPLPTISVRISEDPDSRVVAAIEVIYRDRAPTAAPGGSYTVSHGDKVCGAARIVVEAPIQTKRRGALVLTCIDLSKSQRAGVERLMEKLGYEDNYDTFSVAGASLGVVGSDDPRMVGRETGDTHSALFHDIDSKWDQTFFDQITVSANLHAIDRIIAVDHLGCSCYNEYYSDYGSDYHGDGAGGDPRVRLAAIAHHHANLRAFRAFVCRVYGFADDDSVVSAYLLDDKGEADASRVPEPGRSVPNWEELSIWGLDGGFPWIAPRPYDEPYDPLLEPVPPIRALGLKLPYDEYLKP